MNAKIHSYGAAPPPNISLHKGIPHPHNSTVVGHIGTDTDRSEIFALFPRNYTEGPEGQKHYFEKYEGYAVSIKLLSMLKDEGVHKVCIVEQNGPCRILEYELQQFRSGSFVAYDSAENTIVESREEYENAEFGRFNDPQLVVGESEAIHEWTKMEATIE